MTFNPRLRLAIPALAAIAILVVLVRFHESITTTESLFRGHKAPVQSPANDANKWKPIADAPPLIAFDQLPQAPEPPPEEPKPYRSPIYKPAPTYTPPPVVDPFPLLANTADSPPPIPSHNLPSKDLHVQYGLSAQPPLFIGFTRQWPILLQCVVSYITAGWPASSIYVLENTGVQFANSQGRLSLQNPFYLNHTTLTRLGVNVIQAPTLLSFSQMQNMFLHTAHERNWPYYFYSHQDVVVFSLEDGADNVHRPGDRDWEFYSDEEKERLMNPPAAGEEGYTTIYENCLRDLNVTLERGEKWGFRWYQYDHLTLVNRAAMDAIGGWDSLIPYYATDCDMNARLAMDGWTMKHRRVGIVNDVSTHLKDLAVLYRVPGAEAKWIDPNPPSPEELENEKELKAEEERKKAEEEEEKKKAEEEQQNRAEEEEQMTEGEQKTEEELNQQAEEERKKAEMEQQAQAEQVERAKRQVESTMSPEPIETTSTESDPKEYFRSLVKTTLAMTNYKYRVGNRNRNSWQKSQRGGEGEPYYYNSEGFAEAFEVLVGAGRKIFEMKWARGGCNIAEGFGLQVSDQWKVQPPPKEGN
ncbi:Reticulocyte-binding protein 2-like protein a [Colletotrichum sidae]|uniref:Reticulocyte-binding protein 2-like protein a n=1 Tax=Colletotrichum sidae TaxID=1347389 RepID=A0A4R8T5B6_9PEZI|nr:Reticulocyte-binding protein 2-like protein a [Colletotrichum sidae]